MSTQHTGASLPIPFALGESVWSMGSGHREIVETCPDCLGQYTIIVEIRTGERFEIECRTCWPGGITPSQGVIRRHEYQYEPTPFTPRSVDMHGAEFWYSSSPPGELNRTMVSASTMFHDRAECQAACEARNKELAERDRNAFYERAQRGRKNHAWSLHYWRRQRAQHVADIERIDARLKQIADKGTR